MKESAKYIDMIKQYAKKLAAEDLLAAGDCISLRVDNKMFITLNEDISCTANYDVEEYDLNESVSPYNASMHKAIYLARADINAIITNHSPYCVCVAETGVKIPAVVDDIAQIVGPTTKVAKSKNIEDILKTLKGRNACLIKDDGVIATGRTLDEAYTACMVLEKGAKVFVESTVLGGAKIINFVEAMLMHFVYKTKYSKKDQSAKIEDLK